MSKHFNDWFMNLPVERQRILRENKWMLAEAAFLAGRSTSVVHDVTDQIKSFAKGAKAVVEATSDERQYIWEKFHHKYNFSPCDGYSVTVGTIDERPICISLLQQQINGVKVLFWHAQSQLVDYVMIDEWIQKLIEHLSVDNSYIIKTDTTNFYPSELYNANWR